jgi:DNA-binding MarR family transcriptional regulator
MSPTKRPRDPFLREFPRGSESANAALIALVRTSEAVMAMANKALRHHGLSAAGREAIAVIEGAGRPISPTPIAERLLVTTASVTSLLDTLERRGLVERQADPSDRRRLLVALTDEGRASVDGYLPEMVALQTAVMECVSEQDRRRLQRTLDAILRGVEQLDAASTVAAAPRRGKPRHA